MRWTTLLMSLWTSCSLAFGAQPATPRVVAVAAAASMRGTLEEVKAAFEKRRPGAQVQISYGASGSLTAQIQQGAPVDVFLSADLDFPEKLVREGLVTAEGMVPYARGLLVLWVRKDLGVDPQSLGLRALRAPAIKRIALANPRLAPYGLAAETALQRAGLQDELKSRIVLAENINQAAQYLFTNAAEAGFIAFSLMDNPGLKEGGLVWRVPNELYEPIVQGGVVLKRAPNPAESRAFLEFLAKGEGADILRRHGFEKP